MDHTERKSIMKHQPSDTLYQMDLIDIYRKSNPKAADYTFFSSSHRTFSRIDHVGHKTQLNKFKKIKIISSINYRKKNWKK